jgi:hypothetical protein
MPLPRCEPRQRLHTRRYEFNGFERDDGLWDIEGRMTDTKSYGFDNDDRGHVEAGVPLHDMRIRLTLDDHFVVRDIATATDASPFAICPEVAPNFQAMIGAKIARGWRATVRERVGGTAGCTHLVEMLDAMATVAYQTLMPALRKRKTNKDEAGPPGQGKRLVDTCYAFRSDGPVVKKEWPEFYTGD